MSNKPFVKEPISILLVLLAACISIYLFTFDQNITILFPAFLISIAMGFQTWIKRKTKKGDVETEEDTWQEEETLTKKRVLSDSYYAMISIAGMLATSLFVGYISYRGLNLSVDNAALFGILIACAEEMFFRGVLFIYILTNLKQHPTIAMIGSAVIFMLYHSAVYGGDTSALIYVGIGGFILSWVTWKSKSLTPYIIGHSINNIFAAFGLVITAPRFLAATTLLNITHIITIWGIRL
jgi:membrane protease YdiL (CAAX protease family)